MKLLKGLGFIPVLLVMGACLFSVEASAALMFGVKAGYYLPQGWQDTHDVVYDSSGEITYGVEVAYRFHFPLELAVSGTFISGDGERVWPNQSGGWEKTGDSVSYDLMPITLIGRWRFLREGRVLPYLGAGIGFVTFEEDGAESQDGTGLILQAGSDFSLGKNLSFFLEVEWASYPDVIGNEGVSRFYSEDDVGGITGYAGLRITF